MHEFIDECRTGFERWYSAKHGFDPIRSDEGYEHSAGKRSWECWQAAWESRPPATSGSRFNRWLLMWTRDDLYGKLAKSREQTVTVDEKLNSLMMAVGDLCSSLARESEEDRVPGYTLGSGEDDDE